MPRPKKIDRPVYKKIAIPESVAFLVDMQLYSELEGRVPQSAWADTVTQLLKDWLKDRGVKIG